MARLSCCLALEFLRRAILRSVRDCAFHQRPDLFVQAADALEIASPANLSTSPKAVCDLVSFCSGCSLGCLSER